MSASFEYKIVKPDPGLSDFVESFWMLVNTIEKEQEVVILPDGRIDLFFSFSAKEPFHISLAGLANEPSKSSIASGSVMFAVSLKLLAVEYILNMPITAFENKVQLLPQDFWGITTDDLNDFDSFCRKVSDKIFSFLKEPVDTRKQKLFELVYASDGAIPVKQLAETIGWSSRQINRYFNQWFGMSLKAYCTILRYRASFTNIKQGNIFPENYFSDQAHFIKEIKKYSGVTPKELSRNQNDRFIQFSTLPKK